MPEPQYNPSSKELIVIGEVMATLYPRMGSRADMEGFRKEVIERFGLRGIAVHVDTYDTDVAGVYIPEVTIMGQCDPKDFDHEQERWDVQHDILGIDPNPGAMQRDGTIRSPSKVTSMSPSGLILP